MSEDQDRVHWEPPDMTSSGDGVPTAPDDLVAMLDLLAQTIVQALGFGGCRRQHHSGRRLPGSDLGRR